EGSTLLLAEGLVVFRVPMPARLAGREIRSTDIPATTGCSIIAIMSGDDCITELSPDRRLPVAADLVLIGDDGAEQRFYDRYVNGEALSPLRRVLAWFDGRR
ncbi:MAG: TrkA C-terminal domain-containing protein, partial [Actinomycetota bacterium]